MKITKDKFFSVIESLLFSNSEPITTSQMCLVFENKISEKECVKFLNEWSEELKKSSRGLQLCKVNKGYQLRTKTENKDYLLRLKTKKPFRLSGPSLEVLSILAYKQPCPKQDIDQIRGVDSSHLIRTLMEKELILFAGKSDLPGKPSLYKTSQKFLEVFNLNSLNDLPSEEEIAQLLPDQATEDPETLSEVTENMSVESLEISYEEDEKENQRLKDNLNSINTTVEFLKEEDKKARQAAAAEDADAAADEKEETSDTSTENDNQTDV